ncbi:cysteine-rich RECEPTOR-like kinase [Rhynchospora pubera]|uniref:Cysteine-rich RECEPTOR-like kinase n=1 Tax=Rhynchospora pubera TaxID=906938 RepID=A0AAV8G3Q4_9POAL|nr:cysteine-rich RECEPTOR-like kinase [Rhynchospora pubera]
MVRRGEAGSVQILQYRLRKLKKATNNFSRKNWLGGGGSGDVYKGKLNGEIVAIKKLKGNFVEGMVNLTNEVSMLHSLEHANLVKLLGFCSETGHYLLVYEFIQNGDLYSHLEDINKREEMTWCIRFYIIYGIARGLYYLHHDLKAPFIHRDLKPANVLIDEHYNAKISDFGLSKFLNKNKTHNTTENGGGTPGYYAPEVHSLRKYSPKSDVYNFGLIILEIIAGCTILHYADRNNGEALQHAVWRRWKNKKPLTDIIDQSIRNDSKQDHIKRCIQIGLLCIQNDPKKRPNMEGVWQMLNTNNSLPAPDYPGFLQEGAQSGDTDSTSLSMEEMKVGSTSISKEEMRVGSTSLSKEEMRVGSTSLSKEEMTVHITSLSKEERTVARDTDSTSLSMEEMKVGSTSISKEEMRVGSTSLSKEEMRVGSTSLSKEEMTVRITSLSKEERTVARARRSKEKKNQLVVIKGVGYTFDLCDLLSASAELLSKGSEGTSYIAVLEEGIKVVVKRLKNVVLAPYKFKKHMGEICKVKHRNLLPVRAYYTYEYENLLVFDYVPAGSLSAMLHGTRGSRASPLDWDRRMRVALEAGRALAHLHTGPHLVHGNIKASNVLLRSDLEGVALSGYTLYPLFGNSTPPTSSARGYRAPEFIESPTFKSDVYSFGVLLLELLSGKAPIQASSGEEGIDLPSWVRSVVLEERFQNINEAIQLLQIAMPCVAMVPDERPDMIEVVRMMEEIASRDATDVEEGVRQRCSL